MRLGAGRRRVQQRVAQRRVASWRLQVRGGGRGARLLRPQEQPPHDPLPVGLPPVARARPRRPILLVGEDGSAGNEDQDGHNEVREECLLESEAPRLHRHLDEDEHDGRHLEGADLAGEHEGLVAGEELAEVCHGGEHGGPAERDPEHADKVEGVGELLGERERQVAGCDEDGRDADRALGADLVEDKPHRQADHGRRCEGCGEDKGHALLLSLARDRLPMAEAFEGALVGQEDGPQRGDAEHHT